MRWDCSRNTSLRVCSLGQARWLHPSRTLQNASVAKCQNAIALSSRRTAKKNRSQGKFDGSTPRVDTEVTGQD